MNIKNIIEKLENKKRLWYVRKSSIRPSHSNFSFSILDFIDVRIFFIIIVIIPPICITVRKLLQMSKSIPDFSSSLFFLLGLIMLLTVIMTSTPELGHKYFARIVSHGEIKLDITKFSHTSFKNIEKQPNWKKRIISLGGVIFSEIMMLIACLAIHLCGSIIESCAKLQNCILTECTTELPMLVFILLTLTNLFANLFPQNRNGRPNDGYYFLHPDEIKDEEF